MMKIQMRSDKFVIQTGTLKSAVWYKHTQIGEITFLHVIPTHKNRRLHYRHEENRLFPFISDETATLPYDNRVGDKRDDCIRVYIIEMSISKYPTHCYRNPLANVQRLNKWFGIEYDSVIQTRSNGTVRSFNLSIWYFGVSIEITLNRKILWKAFRCAKLISKVNT